MTHDSTIRIKQINQSELSGYISQVTSEILAISGTIIASTGKLTGSFYPRLTNPNGYIQSGAFISQSDLDASTTQQNTYLSSIYYPISNPNGYAGNLESVMITGDQTISGTKTFDGARIVVTNSSTPIGVVANGMGKDGGHYIDWTSGKIYWGAIDSLSIDLSKKQLIKNDQSVLDWSQGWLDFSGNYLKYNGVNIATQEWVSNNLSGATGTFSSLISGGVNCNGVKTITSNTNIGNGGNLYYGIYLLNGIAVTGILPDATSGKFNYTFKQISDGTGIINTTASQTIDGASSFALIGRYKYVTVQSDDSNWHIVGKG